MKYLIYLLTALLLASCGKDSKQNDYECWYCEDDNACWTCEQLTDTVGLNLYPFAPFPDGWQRDPSISAFAERQIPENFMAGMTTKELFYQWAYCEFSSNFLMHNDVQAGFEYTTKQLNMISEILKRPDLGKMFLEFLQYTNPSDIPEYDDNKDCFQFYYFDLSIFACQPEVIHWLTDEEIDQYIFLQRRHLKAFQSINRGGLYILQSLGSIHFGLGNVMIRYEYEPFTQLIIYPSPASDHGWITQETSSQEEAHAIIDECMDKFIKTRKR